MKQTSATLRRNRPFWALAIALILLMASVLAPAYGQSAVDDPPTDAELTAKLEPIVLSEVRKGDVTTITLEIPVGADTFTTSDRPTTNWSTDPNLRVGFNILQGNGAQRIFMFFDVSSIPSNATVQSANLRAFLNGASPNGDAPMGLLARFLSSQWDASILTWNNFNPSWGAEIGIGQIPASTGWVEASMTGPVQQWVNGTRPNFGIMIQGDETPQQRERVFTAINANDNNHPRLVVTYDVTLDTTPPTSSMTALPEWSPATFALNWSGTDNPGGSGIRHYDLQYRTNGGAWQFLRAATTNTTTNFTGQNNIHYEFRIRAVDNANNFEAFPVTPSTGTRVDTVAPSASMNQLPSLTTTSDFFVSWSGTDAGSGIARYDVEYQVNGGAWQSFMANTTATSGQVTGATSGAVYGFRVRATDQVGNVQPFSVGPQTETTISIGQPGASIVPFTNSIVNQNSFLVQWVGTASPGTSIDSYDVQFSFNNGPWQPWLNNFRGNSQIFTAIMGDGSYAFQVRVRDTSGRISDFFGGPANSIAVDVEAPFITIRAYTSIVAGN